MITIHHRHRETDRRHAIAIRNTALCTKVHRAVKTTEDETKAYSLLRHPVRESIEPITDSQYDMMRYSLTCAKS